MCAFFDLGIRGTVGNHLEFSPTTFCFSSRCWLESFEILHIRLIFKAHPFEIPIRRTTKHRIVSFYKTQWWLTAYFLLRERKSVILMTSQLHHQAEALALEEGQPAFVNDETRQDPYSNGGSPVGWENASGNTFRKNQWENPGVIHGSMDNNIWGNGNLPVNNSYYGRSSDGESLYSSSTTSRYTFGPSNDGIWHGQGNNKMNPNDIATSMSKLQISHNKSRLHNGGASITSMITANSSIPGVIGASSGSTGGSTAASIWQGQQQHLVQPQYSSQQPLYRYSQQQPQGQTFVPGIPPGFVSPMKSVRGEDDSLSYDSRPSKKSGGKRRGGPRRGRSGNNQNRNQSKAKQTNFQLSLQDNNSPSSTFGDDITAASSKASSEAIRMLMKPPASSASIASSHTSGLAASRLPLDALSDSPSNQSSKITHPILPAIKDVCFNPLDQEDEDDDDDSCLWANESARGSPDSKKREWLLRMNRRMAETPVGELDPSTIPVSAIMNAWAKTKSAQGATMVESWLKRAQQEYDAGSTKVVPTTKMYTMAGK